MRLNSEDQTRGFITENTEVFDDCWDQAHALGYALDVVFLWVISEKGDPSDIQYTVMPRDQAVEVFRQLGPDSLADYQREQLAKPAGPASAWLFIIQEFGTLSMRVRRLVQAPGPPS